MSASSSLIGNHQLGATSNATDNYSSSSYDFYSIMHYKLNAFAIDKTQQTIKPLNDQIIADKIGSRQNLSDMDVFKLRKLYECI